MALLHSKHIAHQGCRPDTIGFAKILWLPAMERFSRFKDPLTGINPFLAPKYRPITPWVVARAIARLPLYFLYLAGLPVLPLLIEIRQKSKQQPAGLIYVNSATRFDKGVLRHLYGIKAFEFAKAKTCAVFPEGAATNNQGILHYANERDCEYVVGLRYTSDCIVMRGASFLERLRWLVGFLGHANAVAVTCLRGHELDKAAGLPRLSLDRKSAEEFAERAAKYAQ